MRFPRNAKIFRGQLDIAPLINVLFLLLVFILLAALIYTPGIPVELETNVASSSTDKRVLTISRTGDITLDGKTTGLNDLAQLRGQFRKLPADSVVRVKADPAAPRQVLLLVRDQARDLPIKLEIPPVNIELPEAANVSGTPNPTVSVVVNLNGQFFFENQLIDADQLKARLADAVRRTKEPLTLLVLADKSVQYQTIVDLGLIARSVGIREIRQVVRPKQ